MDWLVIEALAADAAQRQAYSGRVYQLLSTLVSQAASSGASQCPFRICLSRGRTLVYVTELSHEERRVLRWKAELQKVTEWLQHSSDARGAEPGALAIGPLHERFGLSTPQNVTLVVPEGSRSAESKVLRQALSPQPRTRLELLVLQRSSAPEHAAARLSTTELILLQSEFELHFSALAQDARAVAAWSAAYHAQRQLVTIDLELPAGLGRHRLHKLSMQALPTLLHEAIGEDVRAPVQPRAAGPRAHDVDRRRRRWPRARATACRSTARGAPGLCSGTPAALLGAGAARSRTSTSISATSSRLGSSASSAGRSSPARPSSRAG
jgi:hypothetical protein